MIDTIWQYLAIAAIFAICGGLLYGVLEWTITILKFELVGTKRRKKIAKLMEIKRKKEDIK